MDLILLGKGNSFAKMRAEEIEKNENFLLFKEIILKVFEGKVKSVVSLEKIKNTAEFGCKLELL